MTTTTTAGSRTAGIAPCCLRDRHDTRWWLPDGGNRSLLLLRHDPPDGGIAPCSFCDTTHRTAGIADFLLTRHSRQTHGVSSFSPRTYQVPAIAPRLRELLRLSQRRDRLLLPRVPERVRRDGRRHAVRTTPSSTPTMPGRRSAPRAASSHHHSTHTHTPLFAPWWQSARSSRATSSSSSTTTETSRLVRITISHAPWVPSARDPYAPRSSSSDRKVLHRFPRAQLGRAAPLRLPQRAERHVLDVALHAQGDHPLF